jgi:hypothetical protein
MPGKGLPHALPRAFTMAAAVAAALAVGFFARSRMTGPSRSEEASFRRLTFSHGGALYGRFAPDGQTVVYGTVEGRPGDLFLVRTDSVESRPQGNLARHFAFDLVEGRAGGEAEKGPNLSLTGTLARMPLGGSAPREVLEDVLFADWAPNGEDLAVVRLTPEGKRRLEYPIGHPLEESYFLGYRIRVSPTGDLVAYVEGGADGRAAIWVVDRKGGKRVISKSWGPICCPVWSRATGEIFFVAGRSSTDAALRAVSLSGRERVLFSNGGPFLSLDDVSADGRLLVERFASRSGISCLAPGEDRERELGWLDGSLLTSLSEDGRTILLARRAREVATERGLHAQDRRLTGRTPRRRCPSSPLTGRKVGAGDHRQGPAWPRALADRAWLSEESTGGRGRGSRRRAYSCRMVASSCLIRCRRAAASLGGQPGRRAADEHLEPRHRRHRRQRLLTRLEARCLRDERAAGPIVPIVGGSPRTVPARLSSRTKACSSGVPTGAISSRSGTTTSRRASRASTSRPA